MFKEDIIESLKKTWVDTRKWLFWNFFGSLFPVWIGLIVFVACSIKPHISDFSKNGQFTIYSAAMYASALYIVYKEYRLHFSGRNLFGIISTLGLTCSTALFSLIISAEAGKTLLNLNQTFIQYSSIILYLISILIAFLLTSYDLHIERKTREIPDITSKKKKDLRKLDKEFDKV